MQSVAIRVTIRSTGRHLAGSVRSGARRGEARRKKRESRERESENERRKQQDEDEGPRTGDTGAGAECPREARTRESDRRRPASGGGCAGGSGVREGGSRREHNGRDSDGSAAVSAAASSKQTWASGAQEGNSRGDVGARSRKVERGEGGPALALEQVFQLALLEKASTTIRRARPARHTLPLSRTMPPPHQRNLTLHPLPPRKRPAAGRSHVHPTRSACVRQSAPTRPFPWE